jgi:AcrR family transcriptional regulator
MRRTRARIVEVAETLFREHGYDETTIAAIAEEADVSPATVYNYFSSKDEILFADYEALRLDLAAYLAERPSGCTAIEATRDWIRSRRRELRDPENDRLRREIIDTTPALQAQERLRLSYVERDLAAEVGRDLGQPADALWPRLVAAATAAAYLATMQHGAASRDGDDPFELVEDALAFLSGGFDALRELERAGS